MELEVSQASLLGQNIGGKNQWVQTTLLSNYFFTWMISPFFYEVMESKQTLWHRVSSAIYVIYSIYTTLKIALNKPLTMSLKHLLWCCTSTPHLLMSTLATVVDASKVDPTAKFAKYLDTLRVIVTKTQPFDRGHGCNQNCRLFPLSHAKVPINTENRNFVNSCFGLCVFPQHFACYIIFISSTLHFSPNLLFFL